MDDPTCLCFFQQRHQLCRQDIGNLYRQHKSHLDIFCRRHTGVSKIGSRIVEQDINLVKISANLLTKTINIC